MYLTQLIHKLHKNPSAFAEILSRKLTPYVYVNHATLQYAQVTVATYLIVL